MFGLRHGKRGGGAPCKARLPAPGQREAGWEVGLGGACKTKGPPPDLLSEGVELVGLRPPKTPGTPGAGPSPRPIPLLKILRKSSTSSTSLIILR